MATSPAPKRQPLQPGQSTSLASQSIQSPDLDQRADQPYQLLLDSMDLGFHRSELLYDPAGQPIDWRFLDVNSVFERQTGLHQVVGQLGSVVAPNTEAYWLQAYDQVVQTGESIRLEKYDQATDRWYSAHTTRLGPAPSHQFAVVFEDVTERKRQEQNSAFLADIESRFASLTFSQDVTRIASALIGQHLNVSHCLLVDINEPMSVASVFHDHRATSELPSLVGDYQLDSFHTTAEIQQLAAGHPVVINDVLSGRNPAESGANFDALGTRALITAPYVRDGRWKFALGVQVNQPRQWREDEIDFLTELAMRVALRMERARAEEALQQSEERQGFLLKLSDALRPIADPVTIQETAARVLGEQLGVDRAYYGTYDWDQGVAVVERDFFRGEVPSIVGKHPLASYDGSLQSHRNGVLVVDDVEVDHSLPPADVAAYRALSVRSVLNVILVKQDVWVASMTVLHATPHHWTPQEIVLLEATAERTWAAVERARSEGALARSEAKYRTLFEAIDEGFNTIEVLFDEQQKAVDCRILEINPAYSRMTGLGRQVVGQRLRTFLPGIEEGVIERYSQVVRTGEPVRFEEYVAGLDRWFDCYAVRIGDERSHRLAVVFKDITERKRTEDALRQAAQRKDEFLAMLAHELRNPMATLHNTLLLLNLTQGADASLPLDKALAMMSREVGHLNRMVNDLLDVSRIGQGKVQLKKERIDFHKLVEDTLEAARAEFTRRGQLVTRSLSSGPTWVAGDDMRLTQVVRNLLSNAAKYTPTGGQIEVILGSEQGQAVLTVRDSGIGLAADQLEAIFEVFFQVSTSLDRPQGGLGLGLAVVKQLVELQGGSVGVESSGVGQGSTFIVKLPILAWVDPSDPKTGAGAISSPGHRILVVDDHADLALTTMMLLKQRHYEAHYCLSGAKALEAVERLNPDAVLLDLGMPGMDGYETARRLRETPWGRYGVIVALSGYGQEEDKRRTQAAGFDGHLVKPINLTLLMQVLEELLNSTSGS